MSDRKDYECAKIKVKTILKEYQTLPTLPPNLAFSPTFGKLNTERIMEWMREDRLFNVQINIQLHKLVMPNEQG